MYEFKYLNLFAKKYAAQLIVKEVLHSFSHSKILFCNFSKFSEGNKKDNISVKILIKGMLKVVEDSIGYSQRQYISIYN